MNRVTPSVLVVVVVISLVVGGIAGFFLGIAASGAGKAIIQGIAAEEQNAEVSHPTKLAREKFELQYPSNWKINTEDEDYDPDQMFSINSPGNTFVMFVIGSGEMEAEDTLQIQIKQFEKLISSPTINRFESYGSLTGKGATLKGKTMGVRLTVKLFAFHQDDLNMMITQQCPDDDLKPVQPGLTLIENSFHIKTNDTPVKGNIRP